MAFRLRPEKPADPELTRVVREQIKRAQRAASDATSSHVERVHIARTSCKKIRAAVQLVRLARPAIWRRENAWFRDSARMLAPLRDATMLSSTLRSLVRHCDAAERRALDGIRRQLLAHCRREVMPGSDQIERSLSRFVERMRAAARHVSKWHLHMDDAGAIAEGVGETYRRARRDWRNVKGNPSTRGFHEWRKHTKAHAYHHRLLRCAWPTVMREWQHELESLGDQLGEEHDLAMLDQHVRDHAGEFSPPELVASLRGRIKARRDELRTTAIGLGARLFAEKPSALQQRLHAWWSAARQRGSGK